MRRRGFINIGLGAGAAAMLAPGRGLAADARSARAPARLFEVTTSIDLAEAVGPVHLWVPVFAQRGAGQKRVALDFASDADVTLTRDPAFGAEMLHARWGASGETRRLRLVERVATWDRRPGQAAPELSWAERAQWTQLAGTPADQARARSLAHRIASGLRDPEARLRAIYDWTIANTWRDARVAGCGPGDAVAMLRDGRRGGKCADINGLTVCLARAAGLPAREQYGIRLADSSRFGSLGRSGDVTGAQHCRAEVWLSGRGWFAVDPADVRKVVLEEKLPVESSPVRALADAMFGAAEGNWAAYNNAAPISLPGAPREPGLRYLMYPTAMTADGEMDPLHPARFAYRIESREITD